MIVIPMAGLSSRFKHAGFATPKFMLTAGESTLFDLAVQSFARYFTNLPFLFIMRDIDGTEAFVKKACKKMGIENAEYVVLNAPTKGQAHTVRLGLDRVTATEEHPLTIFNIDSFRPAFRFPTWANECDGFLEVFKGKGTHWSFVQPDAANALFVARTAEKERISHLCSDGLYHFTRCSDFLEAAAIQERMAVEDLSGGEMYIAPLYNILISLGLRFRYKLISQKQVYFCGTPDEYTFFLHNQYEVCRKQYLKVMK